MNTVSTSGLLAGRLSEWQRSGRSAEEQLGDVAAEFESLLVAQMLRMARESATAGCFQDGAEGADSVMMEVAEQQLAGAISASGGLGLSRLIVEGLSSSAPPRKPDANADLRISGTGCPICVV